MTTGERPYRYTVLMPRHEAVDMVDAMPVHPSLDDIKAVVLPYLPGDLMGHVAVEGHEMFFDEWQVLKRDSLPVNPVATKFYRAACLRADPRRVDIAELPVIFGPAVVFDDLVWPRGP